MIPDYCNRCFSDLHPDGSVEIVEDDISFNIVFKCLSCGNIITGNTETTNEDNGTISYDFIC